jgi:signal transduction histidine kinase
VTTPPIAAPGRASLPAPGPRALLRTWLWGWLAIVQLVLDLLLAVPYLVVFGILIAGLSSLPAFGFGLVLLVPCLAASMLIGWFERLRVEALIGVRIPSSTRPDPAQPAWRRYLFDGRPWRAVLHLTAVSLWGLLAGTVTAVLVSACLALAALPLYRSVLPAGKLSLPLVPSLPASPLVWGIGLAGLLLLPLVARGLVGVDLALARWLLGPANTERVAELTQRVETLTQTREMTVDSVELERRRIERDLHDGPQQRLVAIAMDLGMARQKLDDDPARARELLDKAHAAAKEAIVEMRQVARGIHPPVLTDRGLDAALSALAARSPVPVSVQVRLAHRPSPTIEAIAYFCVSEALTNVAKHSGARAASVQVSEQTLDQGSTLRVEVCDDGRGGADPARGTGLSGLRQRLAAVDGVLTVHSPPGEGTRLTMLLPERAGPPCGPVTPGTTSGTTDPVRSTP